MLLLHRHLAHEHVVGGMAAALAMGALTADAVALEARKIAQADHTPAPGPARLAGLDEPAVASLAWLVLRSVDPISLMCPLRVA